MDTVDEDEYLDYCCQIFGADDAETLSEYELIYTEDGHEEGCYRRKPALERGL